MVWTILSVTFYSIIMIGFIQPQKLLLTRQSWMIMINKLWEKKYILKRRLKAKTVTHLDYSNIRISNYFKIIDKQHVRFDLPRGLKKSLIHEK